MYHVQREVIRPKKTLRIFKKNFGIVMIIDIVNCWICTRKYRLLHIVIGCPIISPSVFSSANEITGYHYYFETGQSVMNRFTFFSITSHCSGANTVQELTLFRI